MAPFEALYERKCRSPVYWDDRADAVVLGLEMIQEMVEQVHIIRQKMRVAQDRQKSYADLKRSGIVFAVGDKLRKYVTDPTHVLEPKHVEIDEQLSYVEVPKEILDRKVRKTRNGETALVKVLWSNHKVDEDTWVQSGLTGPIRSNGLEFEKLGNSGSTGLVRSWTGFFRSSPGPEFL
ncbi:uncharacterized protein LOC141641137 [Silene latifolia]|uniref:uncharacterized protein LOC141641137 n=1 Tax=Silene latifolia TaxID=37657 RepID=UPI003D76BA5E